MKKKNDSRDLVTKGFFRKELKQELKRFATKAELKQELKRFSTKDDLNSLEVRIDIKIDQLKLEIDDNARGYRDDVLTKLDEVMGELQTMREENTVGSHQLSNLKDQVENHEERITVLENQN